MRESPDGAAGHGRAPAARTVRGVLAALALAGLAACAQQGKVSPSEEAQQAEQPAPAEQAVEQPPADQTLPPPGELELTPPEGEVAETKVGLLLPLSGQHAQLGEALLQAAQMAVFDAAREEFALIVRDTAGTPEGAASAARSAVDAGAELLLGPVFSGSVEAVTPVAQGSRVPVIAFSNNRDVAQPGIYVMGLLPGQQVERVVGYASSQGLSRFAVLAPDQRYGDVVVEGMQRAVERFGGQLARVGFYPPDARDISDTVRRLADYPARQQALRQRKAELRNQGTAAARRELNRLNTLDALGQAPFDAILVSAPSSQRLQAIAPVLPFFDIDPSEVQFLGTNDWNEPSLGTEPALVGGWFAAPPPDSWDTFKTRYRKAFDAEPPRLAALGYDAAALAAVLDRQHHQPQTADATDADAAEMGDGGGVPGISAAQAAPAPRADTPYTEDALTQRSGFAGVGGLFRLNRDGLAERRYAVMEMQRDQLKMLDPAPTSFKELTN